MGNTVQGLDQGQGQGQGNNMTSSRMIYVDPKTEERVIPFQVNKDAVAMLPFVNSTTGGGRRRILRSTIDDGSVPHPNNNEYKQLGNAIDFREDISKINDDTGYCFHFSRSGDDPKYFWVCEEDPIYFTEIGDDTIELQMTGLKAGDWEWWFAPREETDPNTSIKHKFKISKITLNSSMALDKVVVEEGEWNGGGEVQDGSGRIYFKSDGVEYTCTGTAITDRKTGRSLIITAAHCIWDDINEAWVYDAIFIPNRDAIETNLTSADIKRQCDEDICGCWSLSAGVVHDKWRDAGWPHRLAFDYGVFVVDDEGMHQGKSCGSEALDEAVPELEFEVGVDLEGMHTTSLGYSMEHNPDFRYCADNTGFKEAASGVRTYWLSNCGLTGGASGGPWVKNMDSKGKGTIVSVNSWSLASVSGMGGPIIDEKNARCLINAARAVDYEAVAALPDGEQGIFVNCFDRPCITREEDEARRLRGNPDGRKLCEDDAESGGN